MGDSSQYPTQSMRSGNYSCSHRARSSGSRACRSIRHHGPGRMSSTSPSPFAQTEGSSASARSAGPTVRSLAGRRTIPRTHRWEPRRRLHPWFANCRRPKNSPAQNPSGRKVCDNWRKARSCDATSASRAPSRFFRAHPSCLPAAAHSVEVLEVEYQGYCPVSKRRA